MHCQPEGPWSPWLGPDRAGRQPASSKYDARSCDDSWVCLGESGHDGVGSGVALSLAPILSTEVWPMFEDGQAGATVSKPSWPSPHT